MNEIETFHGSIENTGDALRVFELCRQGRLGRVRRRLHEKERRLIRSGSVFVFDEGESGIRRWTDGRLWSPSRILGNFLIYRELERRPAGSVSDGCWGSGDQGNTWLSTPVYPASSLSPGDTGTVSGKSVPMKFDENNPNISNSILSEVGQIGWIDPNKIFSMEQLPCDPGCANSLLGPNSIRLLKSKKLQANSTSSSTSTTENSPTRYIFKPNGLIKKTISARVDGRMQHLVCYFSEEDFIAAHSVNQPNNRNRKASPLMEELRKTVIPADLVLQQNFRKQPAAELGYPTYNVAGQVGGRGKRRYSMNDVGGEYSGVDVGGVGINNFLPIYPKVNNNHSGSSLLPSLDLAGLNGWENECNLIVPATTDLQSILSNTLFQPNVHTHGRPYPPNYYQSSSSGEVPKSDYADEFDGFAVAEGTPPTGLQVTSHDPPLLVGDGFEECQRDVICVTASSPTIFLAE